MIVALVLFACGGNKASEPTGSASVRLSIAQAPRGVTAIRLTVLGDGMTPIAVKVPLDTAFVILELPPRLLTFVVTVEANGGTFSGRTVQPIQAGKDNAVVVTVSLNQAALLFPCRFVTTTPDRTNNHF